MMTVTFLYNPSYAESYLGLRIEINKSPARLELSLRSFWTVGLVRHE